MDSCAVLWKFRSSSCSQVALGTATCTFGAPSTASPCARSDTLCACSSTVYTERKGTWCEYGVQKWSCDEMSCYCSNAKQQGTKMVVRCDALLLRFRSNEISRSTGCGHTNIIPYKALDAVSTSLWHFFLNIKSESYHGD